MTQPKKQRMQRPAAEKKTYTVRCEVKVSRRSDSLKGKLTVVPSPDSQDVLASHTASLLDGGERAKAARILARQLPGVKRENVAAVAESLLPLIDRAWNEKYAEYLSSQKQHEDDRQAPPGGHEPSSGEDRYLVEGGRVCRRRRTPDGHEVIEPLCNFDCRIVEEVVRDDGAESSIELAIEGSLAGGVPLPRATVAAAEFAGMGWTLTAWGTRAVVFAGQGNRDHLRAALQVLSGAVERRTVYAHTGWRRIGDEWVYLHGGECRKCRVGAQVVDLPPVLRHMVLPDVPGGDALRRAVRASLDVLRVGRLRVIVPALGAAYRAPLGPCPASLHLCGPSGVFKTELAALLQQHFGAGFDAANLPGSWSSTANASEGLSFVAKDMVLVVDDFAPGGGTSDVARMHREADRLFRGAGNRQGRQRMRADGTLRPDKPPRCLIVSTGEDMPRGHSCRARVVAVEIGKDDVYTNHLTRCQREAGEGLYAAAMSAYLDWLAPQYGGVLAGLKGEVETLRGAWSQAEQHRRTPSNLAHFELGWRYFLRFALESGAISQPEHDEYLGEVRDALVEVGARQQQHQQDAEPASHFLRLLQASISSLSAHVAAVNGEQPGRHPEAWGWRGRTVGAGEFERVEWQPHGPRVGWLDGAHLYLDPEAAHAAAQTLATKKGESLPIGTRSLGTRLRERGLLVSVDEPRGTNTVRRAVQGKTSSVWHLRARHFFTSAETTHEIFPPDDAEGGQPPHPRGEPDISDIWAAGDAQPFSSNGHAEDAPVLGPPPAT